MIDPMPLRAGDKVGIMAPARKVKPDELSQAIKIIQSWGLEVVLAKGLYCESNQFAGDDRSRADDLQAFLDDDSIRAVFFARGGYGSVRVIDLLNFSNFTRNPKWLVGFSDVTVFHSHVSKNLGVKTLHAPMPLTFSTSAEGMNALTTLHLSLFGLKPAYKVEAHVLNRNGKATARLTGGNLSVLYSLAASVSDVDTTGKILFLEDLDEYLYHIDRMMMALKRSGKLDRLHGLVVGGMSDMRDNTVPFGKDAYQIIGEAVAEYDYPLCFGFPAGHQELNQPLIMGGAVSLQVADDGCVLSFEDEGW